MLSNTSLRIFYKSITRIYRSLIIYSQKSVKLLITYQARALRKLLFCIRHGRRD